MIYNSVYRRNHVYSQAVRSRGNLEFLKENEGSVFPREVAEPQDQPYL